jgi:hypothetical protein
MKHRGIEYGVEEVEPGRWRWIIYPTIGTSRPKVIGERLLHSYDAAVEAGIEEINDGLDRWKNVPRP